MAEITVLRAFEQPEPSVIPRAVACLENGGLIAAPTETRYGLLVRADNPAAVERLCRLKGRSYKAPLSVFVSDPEAIESIAEFTHSGRCLARRFLPGPLTLVLPAREQFVSPIVVEGSIGVRVSASRLVSELVEKVGVPLTATSANRSGAGEAETMDQVIADFGEQVDLYLDGGRLTGPVSTVVDCRSDEVRILRQGAVSAEDILACAQGRI